MNYYLTPQAIAEALNLTAIRKSTSDGLFLLSESDLVSYGIERAKKEGAIELSNNRTKPTQEQPAETAAEESETADAGESTEEEETSTSDVEESAEEEEASDAEESVTEENNNEQTEEE